LLIACVADLRPASQPRNPKNANDLSNSWKVQQKKAVPFVTTVNQGNIFYMEPSAFNYKGLENQRKKAYDNFLRSNIDNEQDKRNFNNEAGEDHLPFRSFRGAVTAAESGNTVQTKLPETSFITATPGTPYNYPIRWNNPHASELEVNIWIMDNKVVVPIQRPTCSGEGHKNNVFEFTIPEDFKTLSSQVTGFTGCNKVGDCILQVYSHSVESRTYSQGTPLVVTATMDPAGTTAKSISDLPEPKLDPALDLSKLRALCRPKTDADAKIKTAVAQQARHVSDVYNHAYQNSDYSPYSGQQPDQISQNLQAAVILKMVTGNRGELGKSLLTNTQKNVQKKIEKQAKNAVKRLEGETNKVINNLLKKRQDALSQDTSSMTNGQVTAKCFRCAEKGATNPRRQQTNTYVPSFKIPPLHVAAARNIVSGKYRNRLIDGEGKLQIYTTALKLMQPAFEKAATVGLGYLGPRIKPATDNKATLSDKTNFKKRNASNKKDGGKYATTEAYAVAQPQNIGNKANIPITATSIKYASAIVVAPTPAGSTPPPTPDYAKDFTLIAANSVCRGNNANDNPPQNYDRQTATSITDCQKKCLAATTCLAIEFYEGQCELWKRVPGATKTLTGATCYKKAAATRNPQPRRVADEFDQLAQELANGDENTLPEDPAEDAPSQMDPNGWGQDNECDQTQSDEDPAQDVECEETAPLYSEGTDGNLMYAGYVPDAPDGGTSQNVASCASVSYLLLGLIALVAV
jgi:hypothetical protein